MSEMYTYYKTVDGMKIWRDLFGYKFRIELQEDQHPTSVVFHFDDLGKLQLDGVHKCGRSYRAWRYLKQYVENVPLMEAILSLQQGEDPVVVKPSWFYGIYGIRYVSHGCWSDPELVWHGKSFNYYDVETYFWWSYNEECEETGTQPDEDKFADWMKIHKDEVKFRLQELADNKCFYGM